MVVCQYWKRGQCRFGNQCRNDHFENASNSGSAFGPPSTFGGQQASAFGKPNAGRERAGGFSNMSATFNNNTPATSAPPGGLAIPSTRPGQVALTVETLKDDIMNNRPTWKLSCFGPAKYEPNLLSNMDQSQEEMRLKAYEAMKLGPQAQSAYAAEEAQLAAASDNTVQQMMSNPTAALQQAEKNRAQAQGTAQTGAFGGGTSSAFGATAGVSAFGAPASTASAFGKPSAFGQTPGANAFGQASAFGQPSAFGANQGQPAATASAFGAPSAFGAQKPAASAFGAPSAFGQTSAFGAAANPSQASGSAFGSTSAFGALGNKPGTGSAFGATSAFGSSTAPSAFGAAPAAGVGAFGQQAPQTGFGSTTQQPGQPSAFGQAAGTTAFGQTSAFGAQPAQPSAFGSSTNASGGSAGASAFGQAASTGSAFGAGTAPATSSAFGAPRQSAFGGSFVPKPSQIDDPFGSFAPKEDDVPPEALAAFKAQTFTWGEVPTIEPPLSVR